ncbi:MAG: hypothetical protein ACRDHW_00945 [Ktedonobacteraceae bacterium]
MPDSNEKLPQKRGSARKAGVNPLSINTTQDQRIRDTRYPDDDALLMEDDTDTSGPQRSPSSAIRLNQPITRRGNRDVSTEARRPIPSIPPRRTQKQDFGPLPASSSAYAPRNTTTANPASPDRRGRRNINWLFYVGLVLMAMLSLWALGAAALSWGTNLYNNFTYGYPRTYQADAVVGHNDSAHNPSHFIAVNLHGQVVIVEFFGGDPSQSRSYVGPDLIGPQSDLLPVTLTFNDFYHTGKTDMVVHIGDQFVVYCNNGTYFTSCDSHHNPTPATTPTATATP